MDTVCTVSQLTTFLLFLQAPPLWSATMAPPVLAAPALAVAAIPPARRAPPQAVQQVQLCSAFQPWHVSWQSLQQCASHWTLTELGYQVLQTQFKEMLLPSRDSSGRDPSFHIMLGPCCPERWH